MTAERKAEKPATITTKQDNAGHHGLTDRSRKLKMKLKAIMDTWTIIEKFGISFEQTDD